MEKVYNFCISVRDVIGRTTDVSHKRKQGRNPFETNMYTPCSWV